MKPSDLVLHDELIHDSCLQGIKLSGAARRGFRHEDFEHLEEQLRELRPHYEKVLIVIEGVYSMDGDVAQLPEFIRLKEKYGCLLMVDEAHSFGTIGKTGCGIAEHWGIDANRVDLWMGTMSKSLASMGGWISGSKALVEYLKFSSPGFVFAAGQTPTLGQAAISALKYMLEEPWRVEKLQSNCLRFCELLWERDLDTGPAKGLSPVIPGRHGRLDAGPAPVRPPARREHQRQADHLPGGGERRRAPALLHDERSHRRAARLHRRHHPAPPRRDPKGAGPGVTARNPTSASWQTRSIITGSRSRPMSG